MTMPLKRFTPMPAGVEVEAVCGLFIFVLCVASLMLFRQLFNKVYVRYQS